MKTIIKSFLFFCLLPLFGHCGVMAQEQVLDSTAFYENLINNPNKIKDLTNAYVFFKKRRKINNEKNYPLGEVSVLIQIAQAQKKIGFLYDSEKSAIDGLKILDKEDSTDFYVKSYRQSLYNHLGKVYREKEDFVKAHKYYDKAINNEKSIKNLVTLLNNKGFVHYEQKQYKLAIEKFQKSYDGSIEIEDSAQEARALDNLGLAQSKINNPEALGNLNESLRIRIALNSKEKIITSYLHLGEYYKDRNDKINALIFANKAIDISSSTNDVAQKKAALALKLDLKSDYDFEAYRIIIDSLESYQKNVKNSYVEAKYENEKLEKRIQEEQLESERQERLKLFYLSIATIILLMSVFVYYLLKSQHKKQKMEEVYNTETRISKKVHDEVANDVYHVMAKLQSDQNIKDGVIDDLENIYIKTRDISRENAAIHVDVHFDKLLRDLLLSFKSDSVNIITKGLSKVNLNTLSKEKKTVLYRVLQELMVNMRKHSQANYVIVSFEKLKGKISIEYKDNGIGCVLKKQNGLINTENRMQSINGTITFESEVNKGFTAKIIV